MRNKEFDQIRSVIEELDDTNVKTFPIIYRVKQEELQANQTLQTVEIRAHRVQERDPTLGKKKERMRQEVARYQARAADKLRQQIDKQNDNFDSKNDSDVFLKRKKLNRTWLDQKKQLVELESLVARLNNGQAEIDRIIGK